MHFYPVQCSYWIKDTQCDSRIDCGYYKQRFVYNMVVCRLYRSHGSDTGSLILRFKSLVVHNLIYGKFITKLITVICCQRMGERLRLKSFDQVISGQVTRMESCPHWQRKLLIQKLKIITHSGDLILRACMVKWIGRSNGHILWFIGITWHSLVA